MWKLRTYLLILVLIAPFRESEASNESVELTAKVWFWGYATACAGAIASLFLSDPQVALERGLRISEVEGVSLVRYHPSLYIGRTYEGESPTEGSVDRAERLLPAEIAKYPKAVRSRMLESVWIAESLKRSGLSVGGTVAWSSPRVVLKGADRDWAFRYGFHHEMGHRLRIFLNKKFPEDAWRALLPRNFRYTQNYDEALSAPEAYGGFFSEENLSQGFLRNYSRVSFDEDWADWNAALFMGGPQFWRAYDSHALVRAKVSLLISVYKQLDPAMDEMYFRRWSGL